jgi:starch synthase (maltosyl-transferring)
MSSGKKAIKTTLPQRSHRVVIKNITPQVECGRYPAKAAAGAPFRFGAILIADGHYQLSARVQYKYAKDKKWKALNLEFIENDLWETMYVPEKTGIIEFKVEAWISELKNWAHTYPQKQDALQGRAVLEQMASYAPAGTQKEILAFLHTIQDQGVRPDDIPADLYQRLQELAMPEDTSLSASYYIYVDREKACFSTWYELFPRSCAASPGNHGTFLDVVNRLPYLADAGFDVLYLPPIHPIGKINRKGKDNSLVAGPVDPGSPWAIGSDEGGHKDVHIELGTIDDFKQLIREAQHHNMEIAMDIALQCAPDHPYIHEHPEWFKWEADGTIRYAENPPKKYEDIVPFDFGTAAWRTLWEELRSIVIFWIEHGIRIFRVDNPHTKSLYFWEWLLADILGRHPDVIFLSEAFTRPHIMEHLAMIGFTQSYTYFTWRNTKEELQQYMTELTKGPKQFFFKPNFWPNTPDILPPHLVAGGDNMHIVRVLLAATLSSNYGLYGPVYERGICEPVKDKEEYANNEKYEIRYWPSMPESDIWKWIQKINRLRKSFPALQVTNNIDFLHIGNDMLMAYIKWDVTGGQHVLIVINLDPNYEQSGWLQIPEKLRMLYGATFYVIDNLTDETYTWNGDRNFVILTPGDKPAHIFSLAKTTANNDI